MQLVTMYYFLPSRESSPKLANPFRPACVRFCVEMRVACTAAAAGSHQTSHALLISSDAEAATRKGRSPSPHFATLYLFIGR